MIKWLRYVLIFLILIGLLVGAFSGVFWLMINNHQFIAAALLTAILALILGTVAYFYDEEN